MRLREEGRSPAAAAAMPRSSASIAASCASASTSISAILAMTSCGVGEDGTVAIRAEGRVVASDVLVLHGAPTRCGREDESPGWLWTSQCRVP